MKFKIVLVAVMASVAIGTTATMAIADNIASGTAIEINDDSKLTVNSFCGLIEPIIDREFNTDTSQCYENINNNTINKVGNLGILKTLNYVDRYDGDRELNNYELTDLLFNIIIKLEKYPQDVVGSQVAVDNSDYATQCSLIAKTGIMTEFNGESTNKQAKEIISKLDTYLANTEKSKIETVDMQCTSELGITENKKIQVEVENTVNISNAIYKNPGSLYELAENWNTIPIINNYANDIRYGFLNIWEGIANPSDIKTLVGEVKEMAICRYPSGSTLWYDLRDDQVELRHPDYMNIGYCNEMKGKLPPDNQVFAIKDYQITGQGTLDWVTQSVYMDKETYLNADCLGFIVEKRAVTNIESDKELVLMIAQIPEFDKSHFR